MSEDPVEYAIDNRRKIEHGCSLTKGARMRPQVQSVYNRQVAKCLSDIDEVFDLPSVVEDRIKRAIEFTCKDVDKLRLKPVTRNGEQNGNTDQDIDGNR